MAVSSSSVSSSRSITTVIACAVGAAAGVVLGTGGWSVLTAVHDTRSITHEQRQLQATVDGTARTIANSESVLVSLETQQREIESEQSKLDTTLGNLRAKVLEAEQRREEVQLAGSRLAAEIDAQTSVLQGLMASRAVQEAALVVKTKQREACVERMVEAKAAWWVTR
jgi:septal ring factor EnvC (AmiA/AmiB activator)